MAARDGGEMTRAYGVWRWTGRLSLAPSLADLVDARIGSLSPGVRDVLELVAFGEPLGLPLLRLARRAGRRRGGRGARADPGRRRRPAPRTSAWPTRSTARWCAGSCPVTRARRLLATLADLVERSGARRRDDLLRVAVWRLDSGTAQDAAPAAGRGRAGVRPLRPGAGAAPGGRGRRGRRRVRRRRAARHRAAVRRPCRTRRSRCWTRATDGPPPRRITARATVAFWGLGRPEAAGRAGRRPHRRRPPTRPGCARSRR